MERRIMVPRWGERRSDCYICTATKPSFLADDSVHINVQDMYSYRLACGSGRLVGCAQGSGSKNESCVVTLISWVSEERIGHTI